MKKSLLPLSILTFFICHASEAVVLSASPNGSPPPPPPPQQATPNQSTGQTAVPAAVSSEINKEQRDTLVTQARSLNKDQLQAVAKSFHQELNPDDPSISKPDTQTSEATKRLQQQKSIDDLKREQAFNALMENVMPLSPDQIIKLHKFYDLTLQAKATPASAPPDPKIISTVVNLEPGSPSPVIRLAAGFVTSVLFIDSTGADWPITAFSIGDPENFNIQWDQKSNTLFIQSLKVYAHGNMAVRLWGLPTPVILTLVSGQRTVDFRVDLQVGGRGPDAKPVVVDTAFSANVNPLLMNLLDGVPPKGSIKLNVSGGLGEAWLNDNKIYFRTKLTLLSPAWLANVSSPDGTHVYELMLTPYIVATQNGKTVDIKLSGL